MEIQRLSLADYLPCSDEHYMNKADDGKYVFYADHLAAIADARDRLDDALLKNGDLAQKYGELLIEARMKEEVIAEKDRRIVHCETCGGSWYDDGLTVECPMCVIAALRAELDAARERLRVVEECYQNNIGNEFLHVYDLWDAIRKAGEVNEL